MIYALQENEQDPENTACGRTVPTAERHIPDAGSTLPKASLIS